MARHTAGVRAPAGSWPAPLGLYAAPRRGSVPCIAGHGMLHAETRIQYPVAHAASLPSQRRATLASRRRATLASRRLHTAGSVTACTARTPGGMPRGMCPHARQHGPQASTARTPASLPRGMSQRAPRARVPSQHGSTAARIRSGDVIAPRCRPSLALCTTLRSSSVRPVQACGSGSSGARPLPPFPQAGVCQTSAYAAPVRPAGQVRNVSARTAGSVTAQEPTARRVRRASPAGRGGAAGRGVRGFVARAAFRAAWASRPADP
jgi:hypothetical protein